MNRSEHLQWAKDRAIAYLKPVTQENQEGRFIAHRNSYYQATPAPQVLVTSKQLSDACASFMSDLTKHPDIDPTAAGMVYAMEVFTGGLNTEQKVRDFINGTN